LAKLKKPFTRVFWEDLFERTDNETLIDWKVLSYSYIEVGLIETAASMAAYFVVFLHNGFTPGDLVKAQRANVYFTNISPDFINSKGQSISAAKQVDSLGQAQGIVYLSIFIVQCFNVYAVKAKFSYPFGKQIVSNYYNLVGIFAGACLSIFIVYTPPLHVVFGGSFRLSPLFWLIPCAFGILLLAWVSLRVVLLRKSIREQTVKDIKGLAMFPTMRTMSLRPKG